MAASIVADPIANVLQRTFQQNGTSNNGMSSYDGRGLMRGGSSASINGSAASSANSHLDASLQVASKKTQIANSTIQFDAPIRYVGSLSTSSSTMMAKSNGASPAKPTVIVLNPQKQGQSNGEASNGKSASSQSDANAIPKPKVVYFSPHNVLVGYRQQRAAGAGMFNVGNTCYLNSTLQALFHTPALYNFLMGNNSHASNCNVGQGNGFIQNCILCAMTHTLKDTLRSNCIKPNKIYEKLKTICKHLVHGRQEDAHEFLRYLIESLQRSYLVSERAPLKTLDTASKETTPFNQIFGGYMRQDVTCLKCKYVSTTFQHFMDLLLDIRQVSNIEDALQLHFRQEQIGGNGANADSMYKCEKCCVKVPAKKRSLIERPPAVLCIQLKRFSLLGGKISKPVQLSRMINLAQYINTGGTGASTSDVQYKLVSMITHVGPSPNCGHYTAIGEAANGQFFQFDDSSVRPISVGQAMNTASYVVFYEMTKASWDRQLHPSSSSNASSTATAAVTNGHQNGNKPSPVITPRVLPPQSNGGPLKNMPKLISTISSHATPVVNRLGVIAASIKKTTTSATTIAANGQHAAPLVKSKGLVPYDYDSDSESMGSTAAKPSQPTALVKPITTSSLSPFVPRAVTVNVLKKVQESKSALPTTSEVSTTAAVAVTTTAPTTSTTSTSFETRKSASGTWMVTDVDHHNPSIASDGSCGSTSGNWVVTPAAAATIPAKPVGDVPRVTSPWTVTPLKKTSSSPLEVNDVKQKADVTKNGTTNGLPKESDTLQLVEHPQQEHKPKLIREPFPLVSTPARKRGSVDDSDADDYDAEFDRGRTKKVRKAIMAPSNGNGSHEQRSNPFQSAQNSQYHNRGGDHSGSDRHHNQNRSWNRGSSSNNRFNGDHSRSRSNSSFGGYKDDLGDRGRRNSFGGHDHGGHHRSHHSHKHHNHKNGFNRSFSGGGGRRDSGYSSNGYRHNNKR